MNSSFVLPLPDAGDLRCSKEIAFFENVSMPTQTFVFSEALCRLDTDSPRKSLYEFRRCCNHNHFNESGFLSLLQFLQKARPEAGETVVILGDNWKPSQFWLLNEFYPSVRFDLWRCTINGTADLPSFAKRRYGFPSAANYLNQSVHLFSNFRSEKANAAIDDLRIQIKVVHNLQPKTIGMRFRPPLRKDCFQEAIEYFAGEMQTICYETPSSTAVRIFARQEDGFPLLQYNLGIFEQTLNHYNTEIRVINRWLYNGVEHSFDNCYRNFILWQLLGMDAHHAEIRQLWHRILLICRTGTPKL